MPGHCPNSCKWPGDHLLHTNLFNFPVQGNYLVRKFLKCILLGFFGDVWSVLCIQCWRQSEEQSTCTGMELVVLAPLIFRAKWVFSETTLGPFCSLQEPSSRREVYFHHGGLRVSRLLSGLVLILTLALQLPSAWGWASLKHHEGKETHSHRERLLRGKSL